MPSDTSTSPAFSVPPSRLRSHVLALTQTTQPRSSRHLQGLQEAAAYIETTWNAQGFPVQRQAFQAKGETYENLWISYGPPQAERIIVGAHYDVCGDQPGADDNASGVAGLLELSAWIAHEKPTLRRRIDFIAWTLEEPPYFATASMGSAIHARWLKSQDIQVAAAISLEMIGYFSDAPTSQDYPISALSWLYPSKGNFLAVVSDLTWAGIQLVRTVKGSFARSTDLPVVSINSPRFVTGMDFSDHRNYWKEGYPALMLTDTAFFRNPHYHRKTDTPDTLDYPRMAKVVEGTRQVLLTLAR